MEAAKARVDGVGSVRLDGRMWGDGGLDQPMGSTSRGLRQVPPVRTRRAPAGSAAEPQGLDGTSTVAACGGSPGIRTRDGGFRAMFSQAVLSRTNQPQEHKGEVRESR